MALMKCHECGGQVSDKAPFCPHCGIEIVGKVQEAGEIIDLVEPADLKDDLPGMSYSRPKAGNTAKWIVLTGIAVVFTLSAYPAYQRFKEGIKPKPVAQTAQEDQIEPFIPEYLKGLSRLTVDNLLAAYNNEAAAKARYEMKDVIVVGVVERVYEGSGGGWVLELRGSRYGYYVKCALKKDQPAHELTPGGKAVVKGLCLGKIFLDVALGDCETLALARR